METTHQGAWSVLGKCTWRQLFPLAFSQYCKMEKAFESTAAIYSKTELNSISLLESQIFPHTALCMQEASTSISIYYQQAKWGIWSHNPMKVFFVSKAHSSFRRIKRCTTYEDETLTMVAPCFPNSSIVLQHLGSSHKHIEHYVCCKQLTVA